VEVVLLEPRESRVAFLEMVLSTLRLENASVLRARAEEAPVHGNVCLARALAKPLASWALCSPLLTPGGKVVYFAGTSFGPSEVAALTEAGVRAKNCDASLFPGYGPLVIMQSDS